MPSKHRSQVERTRSIKRVLVGLLIANVAVIGAKVAVGFATGSLSVASDAVHSSIDAMNNVLALGIIWVAGLAPDEDHPYGHHKFETLGTLGIVVFLSITGFEVVKGAIIRLVSGTVPIDISNGELAVLLATLGVNTAVATYETRRGRELNSQILIADAAHTRADIFITTGVILGVLLSRSGFAAADSIVALLVAGAIVVIAYRIVIPAIPVLVDEQVVDYRDIERIARSVDGVVEAYDIRSRGSAEQRFAELTLAVAGNATVEYGHQIADLVEERLRKDLEIHQIVVHVEPC